jgi:hypothetical protein
MQNYNPATGIISLIIHKIVYFGQSPQRFIVDMTPYTKRYWNQHLSNNLVFPDLQFGQTQENKIPDA